MVKLLRVSLARVCEKPEGRGGFGVDTANYTVEAGYEIWEDVDSQRVYIAKDGKTIWTPFSNVIRAEPSEHVSFEESSTEQKRGPGRPRKYPLVDEA